MNRWLLSGCILLVLLLAALYVFIPSEIEVRKVVPVKCNVEAAARVLADSDRWNVWWPGGGGPERSAEGHPVWIYGKGDYAVLQRFWRSAAVEIGDAGYRTPSMLTLVPHRGIDSCFMEWSFQRRASWNPVRRLRDYWAARSIHAEMGVILDGLRNYLETDSLLYGVGITKGRVRDTLVAEITRKEPVYPTTATVYSIVDRLQDFVKGYGGKVVGPPIMNATEDTDGYLMHVAVPVDHRAAVRDGIVFHYIPITALFLTAEIHGGEWTVRQEVKQLDYYMSDHQKVAVAVPFLQLVTDRRVEPDTSKWVSRLYVPFF